MGRLKAYACALLVVFPAYVGRASAALGRLLGR